MIADIILRCPYCKDEEETVKLYQDVWFSNTTLLIRILGKCNNCLRSWKLINKVIPKGE